MNNQDFKNIKVLVWDLDGTLYKSLPELGQAMHGAFIKILQEHKNLSHEEAAKLLEETKKIHKGNTKSLSALGCGDRVSLIRRIESLVNKASFLKIDQKLQSVFQELHSFQHVLLSDTTHKTIVAELEALGLSHTIFNFIIGVDDMGTTKPDLSFFKSALNQTKLPAKDHLMIGDRVEIDLLPAKQLSMKTCLVWDTNNYKEVDFSLSTVYDVVKLFEEKSV